MMEKNIKTLVCHGDSLTAPEELERGSIWPSLVENRLKINVINSGIGGDTTGGLLSRFYPADDGLHPNKAGHRLMADKTVEMLKDRFNVERNE